MRKITIPLKNVRGKDKFGKILTESVHRGHDKQGGAFLYKALWQQNLQKKPHIFVMFIVSYYATYGSI